MNGGTTGPDVDHLTRTSRYVKESDTDEILDINLQKFLNEIYAFKQYFWTEFINSRKSQDPTVIEEYRNILKKMYECLINNKECNLTQYQSFNTSNTVLSASIKLIDRIQSEYWLKRTLIQFPFTLNMNKILDNK